MVLRVEATSRESRLSPRDAEPLLELGADCLVTGHPTFSEIGNLVPESFGSTLAHVRGQHPQDLCPALIIHIRPGSRAHYDQRKAPDRGNGQAEGT